jgi:hypothetical protein
MPASADGRCGVVCQRTETVCGFTGAVRVGAALDSVRMVWPDASAISIVMGVVVADFR